MPKYRSATCVRHHFCPRVRPFFLPQSIYNNRIVAMCDHGRGSDGRSRAAGTGGELRPE